jgi:hypothetical protein
MERSPLLRKVLNGFAVEIDAENLGEKQERRELYVK